MAQRRHLVIFARSPRLGRGKTRLARDIGQLAAWRFQRVMLGHTLRRLVADRRWQGWIATTPCRAGAWPSWYRTIPQGQGDLGTRLASVVRRLPPGPVVIVGCDLPDITQGDIAQAFTMLKGRQAVFGPALDGGFWLIGLTQEARRMDAFCGVRWSTERALADVVSNLGGRTIGFLGWRRDVDCSFDLATYPRWMMLTARPSRSELVRPSMATAP